MPHQRWSTREKLTGELQQGCPRRRGAGSCSAKSLSLAISLLLHSLPNLTATLKGWDGSWKLRSSLKTKLPALYLLLQPVSVASIFPGKWLSGLPGNVGSASWGRSWVLRRGVGRASAAAFSLRTIWTTFCRTSCDSPLTRTAGCGHG